MESCIYEGIVHHERLTPVNHRFQYRMFMLYLDLAEVPSLTRAGLISPRRFAPASFVRADHFGDPARSLDEAVRAVAGQQTGMTLEGPIRVLTHLRYFGYYFSPLSLFYCFERDGRTLQAVVAEVQNTPWLERHCYVLWSGNRDDSGAHRHAKHFHVSPFMAMDMEYVWRVPAPSDVLHVAIANEADKRAFFQAAIRFQRRPLTRSGLFSMQWRHPLMTMQISLAIHVQAFQLWRKKCPVYSHPKHRLDPSSVPAPGCSIAGVEMG